MVAETSSPVVGQKEIHLANYTDYILDTGKIRIISWTNEKYGNAFVSRIAPSLFDFKRSETSDFLVGPSKLTFFARFSLGMDRELLVVNIHSFNIVRAQAYQKHWRQRLK